MLLGVITIGAQFYLSINNYLKTECILTSIQRDIYILNQLKEARFHFEYARKEEKNWLLFKNTSYIKSRQRSLATVQNLVEVVKKEGSSDHELTEMIESFESHFLNYVSSGDELIGLDDIKKIEAFTTMVKIIDTELVEIVSKITNRILQNVGEKDNLMAETLRFYIKSAFFVTAFGMILFASIGFFWIYGIRRRLTKLTHATLAISLGNYTPQLDTSMSDELGILASNFNDMVRKVASREEKIGHITEKLIQTNNMLKKRLNVDAL